MPFAVFRRHERKLLAIFAILAMIGFVLSDSLPALLGNRNESHQADNVVAKLYGKDVRLSDLEALGYERRMSNAFMANLMGRMYGMSRPNFFGEIDTGSLVDAYILQHEADALGIPHEPQLARDWLGQLVGPQLDATMFELVLEPFRNQSRITGEGMLSMLANQIRLREMQSLPGLPDVTPLDLYEAYRQRYEQVSAHAVKVPVADFVGQVREPSETEVQAFYDKYKDTLPDPHRPTPGFRIPRLVQAEYVVADGDKIAGELRPTITEKELRDYYDTRKTDPQFTLPALPVLPTDLFEDSLTLTPAPKKPEDLSPEVRPDRTPRPIPFDEIKPALASDLAQEKARDQIDRKFEPIRVAVLDFADKYSEIVDDNKQAKSRGEAEQPLPTKPSFKEIAQKQGLNLETTPKLSREEAEHYGAISEAHVGVSRMSEGRPFAEELFSSQDILFEPIELIDRGNHYYLAWKIADSAPRVPPLSEIRAQVVQAWKLEQARPLAQKEAKALAEKAKAAGGKLSTEVTGTRPVVTTPPLSMLESSSIPVPGQFMPPRPRPTEIREIPDASDELREALFNLKEGEVAVEADKPVSAYYVLTLARRVPVSYETLYATNGPLMSLQMEVMAEASEKRLQNWMASLRAKAGLPPDWTPPEEAEPRLARRRD